MKIAVPFFRKIWIFRRFSADGESSIVCFGFAFAWPPHHRDSLSLFAFTRCPTILVICFFGFFFTGQGLPFSAFSLPGRVCRFQLFLHRAELLRFFTTPLPSSIYDWVCTFAAFLRLLFFHVALRSFSRRRSRRLFFFVFLLYRRNSFPFVPSVLSPTLPDPVCSRGGDLPYSSVRFCITTPSRKTVGISSIPLPF